MTRFYFLILLLAIVLFGCDNGIDKSLVDQAAKLNSPFSDFVLYRYHVESSMAFGSGFTAIKILPSEEKCDYTDRNFFTFDNNYPLLIKWKNKDTLSVKCVGGGPLADKQPINRGFQKWKDWTFEVEYYSIYSTGTNGSHTLEDYQLLPHSISFKTKGDLFLFENNNVTLELDSTKISIQEFKIDTFKAKTGLSLSNYEFDMNSKYKMTDFDRLQPFIKQNP